MIAYPGKNIIPIKSKQILGPLIVIMISYIYDVIIYNFLNSNLIYLIFPVMNKIKFFPHLFF